MFGQTTIGCLIRTIHQQKCKVTYTYASIRTAATMDSTGHRIIHKYDRSNILCPPPSLKALKYMSSGYYHPITSPIRPSDGVIDMRSDVLSIPTPDMLNSMLTATLGDDVFREDATTISLEKKMAKEFGKEAALFVPSGTMGNLISVLAHCPERGGEVLLGDLSHIYLYEQGGIAQFGGLHPRAVVNLPDGTFDVNKLRSELIRPLDDPHQPFTKLICVENTHNFCGGTVLPLEFLANVKALARDIGVPVHMDGARMMNAAVALGITPAELLKNVDSVNQCFSKGLGAPVGSIIAGSKQFIERAIRLRKALGGGMRQPGVLAAPASISYDQAKVTLADDNKHAKLIAEAIVGCGRNSKMSVDVSLVHSNIIMVDMLTAGYDANMLCERLEKVTEEEVNALGERISVRIIPFTDRRARITTHNGVQLADVNRVIKKLQYVWKELQ